jgi:hypothetical protein
MSYVKTAYKNSSITIIQKIYFRANALYFLEWGQYDQLIELNKLILAPYYNGILREQGKYCQEIQNFRDSHGGKWPYEYENNI